MLTSSSYVWKEGEAEEEAEVQNRPDTAPFNPKGIFEDRIARQGASDCLAPSVEHMTPGLGF